MVKGTKNGELSQLSMEVQKLPYVKLKNIFLKKSSEMRQFVRGGNLHLYDTSTLKSEYEKDRQIYLERKSKKLFDDQRRSTGQNNKVIDPLIGLSYDQPSKFIGPILHKLNIRQEQLTSCINKKIAKGLRTLDEICKEEESKIIDRVPFSIGDYLTESKHSYSRM